MKKQLLLLIASIFAYSELKPMHSGGAVAGAAVGGLVGGYILGRLIPRKEKDQAYYNHKEKKIAQQEGNKQKKKHLKQVKEHKNALDRLVKDGKEHSEAAQHHRTQIQHHEGIIAEIEKELREIFYGDSESDSKTSHKNSSNK